MSSIPYRTILLALVILAFAAVMPACAAPVEAAPQVPVGASVANPGGCAAPTLDLSALSAQASVCKAAVSQPAPAFQPDFMVTYHGYCRCSCSRVPNCNTNADCGGGRCLGGITCC